jgi:hypothetical protein
VLLCVQVNAEVEVEVEVVVRGLARAVVWLALRLKMKLQLELELELEAMAARLLFLCLVFLESRFALLLLCFLLGYPGPLDRRCSSLLTFPWLQYQTVSISLSCACVSMNMIEVEFSSSSTSSLLFLIDCSSLASECFLLTFSNINLAHYLALLSPCKQQFILDLSHVDRPRGCQNKAKEHMCKTIYNFFPK